MTLSSPSPSPPSRGILMILSPAKTLNLEPAVKLAAHWTRPDCNDEKTRHVAALMKQRTQGELVKLLSVSANLASTAREYWSSFHEDGAERPADPGLKPAIYSFAGAAYQGLQADTCSDAAMEYMQQNLRVIDPLYGILKPLDVMQPYRLEMATKHVFPDKSTKLSDWWKPCITARLGKDLEARSNKMLLNLASDEYSIAVDSSELPEGTRYIKVVFWEEGRAIAVHAKKARGMMVRFIAENNVQDITGVQGFDKEGYSFVKEQSDATTLVFDRKKQASVKKPPITKGKASLSEPSKKKARSKK